MKLYTVTLLNCDIFTDANCSTKNRSAIVFIQVIW